MVVYCSFCQKECLQVFSSVLRFPYKQDVRVLTPVYFFGGSCFINVICIYLFTHICVKHDFHIRWTRSKVTTTGVTSGAGAARPSGVRVAQSLVICVVVHYCVSLCHFLAIVVSVLKFTVLVSSTFLGFILFCGEAINDIILWDKDKYSFSCILIYHWQRQNSNIAL